MKRRDFIALLGGAAAWPVVARAQHGERMRSVGVLMSSRRGRPEGQARVAAFLQSVQELDWTVGRNRQQVGENKRAAGRESSSGSS